jgi:rhodanese-related sulfurtransferase
MIDFTGSRAVVDECTAWPFELVVHGYGARSAGLRASRPASLNPMSAAEDGSGIQIDPERVAEWLASEPELQFVDVREPHEREAGHIKTTRHIELVKLSAAAESFDRDRPVVFYCRVGARSTMAAQAFRASGFEAFSMQGGLVRWAQEGRPLSPEDGYVADH